MESVKEKIIKKHLKSQSFALTGLRVAFLTELNFRIELGIAFIVVLLAILFKCDLFEWSLLLISIFMVLAAELFNTALEYLADGFTKESNDFIRYAKDIAAAAVWLVSALAVILGIMVFLHYIRRNGLPCCGLIS